MTQRTFFPMQDLRELMDPETVRNRKINCIKHIRAMTGEGLKEAKDFFEKEWQPFVLSGQRSTTTSASVFQTSEIENLKDRLTALELQVNRLVQSNMPKASAKDIFDDT